jgi:hypothetical protein
VWVRATKLQMKKSEESKLRRSRMPPLMWKISLLPFHHQTPPFCDLLGGRVVDWIGALTRNYWFTACCFCCPWRQSGNSRKKLVDGALSKIARFANRFPFLVRFWCGSMNRTCLPPQLINVLRGLSLSLVERTKRVESKVDDLVRDTTLTNVSVCWFMLYDLSC